MAITKILKAIADETRMNILTLLLHHNHCVRALAGELCLTEATVSQHLKILREAGVVEGERSGYYMHYRVRRDALRELADALGALAATEAPGREPAGGCHGGDTPDCHRAGTCDDATREFCHGKELDKEGRHGQG